tara:strand:+ start:1243 stop:1632 length:390 start_codon:yes stop_codon:yes gene_type:complete
MTDCQRTYTATSFSGLLNALTYNVKSLLNRVCTLETNATIASDAVYWHVEIPIPVNVSSVQLDLDAELAPAWIITKEHLGRVILFANSVSGNLIEIARLNWVDRIITVDLNGVSNVTGQTLHFEFVFKP